MTTVSAIGGRIDEPWMPKPSPEQRFWQASAGWPAVSWPRSANVNVNPQTVVDAPSRRPDEMSVKAATVWTDWWQIDHRLRRWVADRPTTCVVGWRIDPPPASLGGRSTTVSPQETG